ncbi:MAG: hypothetical protein HC795_03900 [Coleofasciculaceae cyanobacterium RL_1_1]|nr:hypothetical protein [Coleofasciculaceae cyanobacterium RL_1_1]
MHYALIGTLYFFLAASIALAMIDLASNLFYVGLAASILVCSGTPSHCQLARSLPDNFPIFP